MQPQVTDFLRNALTLVISSCCQTGDQNITSFPSQDHTVSFVFNTAVRGSQQVKSYSDAGLFQLAFSCARPGTANVTSGHPLSSKRSLCCNHLKTCPDTGSHFIQVVHWQVTTMCR